MSSLNQVELIGRVGRDPEIKSFQNGKIANFSIATGETWKDKTTGEKKESTEWHNVSVSGEGLVRVIENYINKGDQIYVRGKLVTRKWKDQSGNDRYSTEVQVRGFDAKLILLGGKSGSGSSNSKQSNVTNNNLSDQIDDDIPF